MAQHKSMDDRSMVERQNAFLEKFEKYVSVTRACQKAKIPRRTVYNWIDTDEAFKVQYKKSEQIAITLLEDEATRRAYAGTLEPVYQGGKKVGSVRHYSDTMLIFLLKCRKSEVYRDVIRNENTGKDGGPIETKSTVVISNVDYTKIPTEALQAIVNARIKVIDNGQENGNGSIH